jgi:hypothetical protein
MFLVMNIYTFINLTFTERLTDAIKYLPGDHCTKFQSNIKGIKLLNNITSRKYVENEYYIFYIKDSIEVFNEILNGSLNSSKKIDNFIKYILHTPLYKEPLDLIVNHSTKFLEEDFDIFFNSNVWLSKIITRNGIVYEF